MDRPQGTRGNLSVALALQQVEESRFVEEALLPAQRCRGIWTSLGALELGDLDQC